MSTVLTNLRRELRIGAIAAPPTAFHALGSAQGKMMESKRFAQVSRKFFPKIRTHVILLFEGGAQIYARRKSADPSSAMREAEEIVLHDRVFAIARRAARLSDVSFTLVLDKAKAGVLMVVAILLMLFAPSSDRRPFAVSALGLALGTDQSYKDAMQQTPKLVPFPDRGPGRPREFDIDAAVADAIEVFRTHGYHGTSVQDLTDGTGLARGSLYKAFHDKRSLFLAALDHYTAASLKRVGDNLSQPGSARAAIREALMGYARRAAEAQGRQGCLITAAAMEMMPGDAEVGALITRMFRRIEDLFAAAVIRGQASGEIPSDYDERAIAKLFLCTVQGLRVLGKTGPSERELEEVVDAAMRALA